MQSRETFANQSPDSPRAGFHGLDHTALVIPPDSDVDSTENESTVDIAPQQHADASGVALLPFQQSSSSWALLRRCFVNLLLPFVNGLMLGFGELFAHEAAYRLGWSQTKVFPAHRRAIKSSL